MSAGFGYIPNIGVRTAWQGHIVHLTRTPHPVRRPGRRGRQCRRFPMPSSTSANRPHARALPSGLRENCRHPFQGSRAPGGGRGRRSRVPRLPLRTLPLPLHQQRVGVGQPRAEAANPCRAGLSVRAFADSHARCGAFRDGRGLDKYEMVH